MEVARDSPDWEPPIRGQPERFHGVVFEGLSDGTPYSAWVGLLLEFFARLNQTPTLARVNLRTERFLKFGSFLAHYFNRDKKIDSVDRTSVGLFLENDGVPPVRLDFPIGSVVSLSGRRRHAHFTWRARGGIDLVEMFTWLVTEVIKMSDTRYGYAFARDARFGPTAYVYGHLMGLDRGSEIETDAVERIGAWAREHWPERTAQRYLISMLRDVYLAQALSSSHLDARVFENSLGDWIKARSARGTVTKVAPDLFLWTIPPEHLLDVRRALAPSGILISEERSWDGANLSPRD